MVRINEFYTVHRPKQHSAHSLLKDGTKTLVEPQPTEIELVWCLRSIGVYLESFEYFNNRGDERFLTVNWRRK